MRSLLLGLALAGCGGVDVAMVDAGCGGGDDGPHWSGAINLPFDGELHWADGLGHATGPIAGANFSGGVGTICYHGQTLDATIYREIPFPPYDLAAIVATTASNIIVLYAYCQNGAVQNWFYESLDEPVTVQSVQSPGFCTLMHTATGAAPIFDVWNGPPPDLLHAANATVTGAGVTIDNGAGSATLDGQKYDVTAFNWVDCSNCSATGWYELHALLRSGPQVSFGIFYLIDNDQTHVSFDYGFRFDVPGASPPTAKLPATWVIH